LLELVIVDTVVVVLLAGLVAGLLRSHADILRALHSLGVGVGDPSSGEPADADGPDSVTDGDHPGRQSRDRTAARFHLGTAMPAGRDSVSAHDLTGVGADGEALHIPVTHTQHFTLLAFLTSGCTTCTGFWDALAEPERRGLPAEVRPVIVTKGPELELPAEVRSRAPSDVAVVMSSKAWDDYEVPGSPFFVLVDGRRSERAGEGVGRRFEQVAELVKRALADARSAEGPSGRGPSARIAFAGGLDGGAREALNDRDLMAAGIHPGHPSLYPSSLDEVVAGPPVPGGSEGQWDGRLDDHRGRD